MHSKGTENRGLDPELFAVICQAYNEQPFHQTFGFEISYLGKGLAGMKMITDLKFSTQGDRVHGGAIASIADTVMSLAAATAGYLYRTAEMKLNFIAPVYAQTELRAEARVVHPGKTLAVVEAEYYNHEGKLAAKSLGTFFRDIKSPAVDDY